VLRGESLIETAGGEGSGSGSGSSELGGPYGGEALLGFGVRCRGRPVDPEREFLLLLDGFALFLELPCRLGPADPRPEFLLPLDWLLLFLEPPSRLALGPVPPDWPPLSTGLPCRLSP